VADSATPDTGGSNARHAALASLALGLAIALAANLTYAVPRGPVTVGLGLVAPLVLPVVLYLRTTFTPSGFWQRTVRELATLAVAGPAAAVSYSHTFNLVLDAHEPWILAVLAPLSSDGLAGMATLALHRLRQVSAGDVSVSARQTMDRLYEQLGTTTIPRRPTAKPRPERTRRVVADEPVKSKLSPQEWARQNWPVNGGEIRLATGVSRGYAYKVAAEVKAEQEAAS
jgi:hypothetical protein